MGTYLSTPRTEKEVEEENNQFFDYGMAAMQGWRVNMEDSHLGILNATDTPGDGLFGVFDGHGGKEVAVFCAKYLKDVFVSQANYKQGDIKQALVDTFLHMDQLLVQPEHQEQLKLWQNQNNEEENRTEFELSVLPPSMQEAIRENLGVSEGAKLVLTTDGGGDKAGDEEDEEGGDPKGAGASGVPANGAVDSEVSRGQQDCQNDSSAEFDGNSISAAGCTSVVAFVQNSNLWVANAGDSRCVLCRNGTAIAMTEDHKPTDPEENERIVKAGGYVTEGRVNGTLNLSRAIGDLEYKQVKSIGPEAQMVTCFPEVRHIPLQHGDEFMVLACDGIWEVMENQKVVDYVREKLLLNIQPRQICEQLCDSCLATEVGPMGKGCDNMSVMIIVFKTFAATLRENTEERG
eukprot:TRINITY_DN3810_c0_g2_i1.p1 TRINITY_DN3810_c0_g2~~TRINITY_DN3810_c0_g2_i1.p1  ORF type:complete len:404 (-),score=115.38 TRINITY_DN3810_c0_g2_i1:512-1723(-)